MPEPLDWPRRRDRIAADNRAEVEGWIEERVADLTGQGMWLEDARRRAREEFGDVDRATRYAERQDIVASVRRRVRRWVEELAADVRIAARTLARTPTVTAVVLLTFALGIGATTAVYSVVHAMLLRPLPFGNEPSLMWIATTDNGVIRPGAGGARVSGAGVAALMEHTTSFTGFVSVSPGSFVFADDDRREEILGASFTVGGFDVLEAYPAIGRAFTAADIDVRPRPVILLDELWRVRFGADTAVIGRRIDIDGGAAGSRRRHAAGLPRSNLRGRRVPYSRRESPCHALARVSRRVASAYQPRLWTAQARRLARGRRGRRPSRDA